MALYGKKIGDFFLLLASASNKLQRLNKKVKHLRDSTRNRQIQSEVTQNQCSHLAILEKVKGRRSSKC